MNPSWSTFFEVCLAVNLSYSYQTKLCLAYRAALLTPNLAGYCSSCRIPSQSSFPRPPTKWAIRQQCLHSHYNVYKCYPYPNPNPNIGPYNFVNVGKKTKEKDAKTYLFPNVQCPLFNGPRILLFVSVQILLHCRWYECFYTTVAYSNFETDLNQSCLVKDRWNCFFNKFQISSKGNWCLENIKVCYFNQILVENILSMILDQVLKLGVNISISKTIEFTQHR